jgi:uncharacterized protein DUF3131
VPLTAEGLFLASLSVMNIAIVGSSGSRKWRTVLRFCALSVALGATACSPSEAQGDGTGGQPAGAATRRSGAPLTDAERSFYREMAAQAWKYLDTYYQKRTGLVNATPDWPHTTLWDVGGQLLGYQAAKELGLIDQAQFDERTKRTLGFLEKARTYKGVAYAKLYSTTTGAVSKESHAGWTATDLGRFLLALKIIATREPHLAAQAERVARRIDFKKIVKNGYLYGQEPGSKRGTLHTYQEGRIGYEQYVAAGFSQWGADVSKAMDVKANGRPKEIFGVTILEDTRWQDRLLSEPFILYEIELGMPQDMRDLASNVLKVQQARFDSTGIVTIASEDAVAVPPRYFYYYCVYCNGKPFVIDIANPGHERDSPRWVSTKGAFGWHAIMPNEYTKKATEYVAAALDTTRGWASGVFEGTGKSTRSWDVNTAAVLLEIASYQLRGGRPLIQHATVATP